MEIRITIEAKISSLIDFEFIFILRCLTQIFMEKIEPGDNDQVVRGEAPFSERKSGFLTEFISPNCR